MKGKTQPFKRSAVVLMMQIQQNHGSRLGFNSFIDNKIIYWNAPSQDSKYAAKSKNKSLWGNMRRKLILDHMSCRRQ
ncbi:hypothetical protein C5167_004089 [Papaver somniferum]|nr:hypothetical protein C5167_004089 [Papaver somniferum]